MKKAIRSRRASDSDGRGGGGSITNEGDGQRGGSAYPRAKGAEVARRGRNVRDLCHYDRGQKNGRGGAGEGGPGSSSWSFSGGSSQRKKRKERRGDPEGSFDEGSAESRRPVKEDRSIVQGGRLKKSF